MNLLLITTCFLLFAFIDAENPKDIRKDLRSEVRKRLDSRFPSKLKKPAKWVVSKVKESLEERMKAWNAKNRKFSEKVVLSICYSQMLSL